MISTDNKSYIHEAFAQQVEKDPDIDAAQMYYHEDGEKVLTPPTGYNLTYRELDLKAAELARRLIDAGNVNGTVTAVMLDNPLDIVTAVMAVLKAGGIYLLINPTDPREYNNYILEHSRAKTIITPSPAGESDTGKIKLIKSFCGGPGGGILEKSPLAAGGTNIEVDQPAFLYYSLHLTGKSGAIILTLQDIFNWIKFNIEKLKIDFSRTLYVVSGRSEMNFPIWLANLVCGGKIYFYPLPGAHWDRDTAGLAQIMAENKFKSFVCSLAFLEKLNSQKAYGEILPPGLSNIVSAGETCFDAHELKAFLKQKKVRWHNYYGYPDIKMITTLAEEPGSAAKGNRFKHVGRPVSSTRVYILDSTQKPVSIGVTGDLYISGHAAPHRYFQNDFLNRTHFLDSPFLARTTMFKSCHQAHWLPDGKICLSPRPGEMIVISDCRISLAGIEIALLGNPLVDDCAVITKTIAGSTSTLTAFVVPAEGAGKVEEIGDLLNKYLEDYLYKEILPLGFAVLSSLPRTPEGFVDREYLEELEYLDSSQIKCLEQEIKKDPGIENAAVIVEEKIDPPLPLHIKDFLPRQPGTGEPGETGETRAPGEPGETTKARETSIGQSQQIPPAAHPGAETGVKPLALVHGGELKIETRDPQTLVQILERAAEKHGDNGIIYIQPDGTDYFQTYPSLLETAERVLAGLKVLGLQPGDKAILQLGAIEDFAAAFWGCILGGIVPVPYSVPGMLNKEHSETRTLDKVRQILDNPLVISDESLSAPLASLFSDIKVVELRELQAASPCKDHYKGDPEDLALLLFTSGSTGIPKGVQFCHRGILAREKAAIRFCDLSAHDISCNWLPLEHVVGLLMFHIKQVYLGCKQVQARNDYILSDPLRWVDLMSKYKVTLTFAPNFAYSLLNSKFKQTLSSLSTPEWDLSWLKIVNVGAEPINANTMKEFLKLFAPYGLSKTAVHPSWGMSETGSGVVYSKKFSLDTDEGIHVLEQARSGEFIRHGAPAKEKDKEKAQIPGTTDQLTFVEVGRPFAGVSLRIVDADNRVCAEGLVGHLQVKGTTLFSGYYRNPEKNREVFSHDGWFATGDLGFIRDGCLTITGRDKDVIIINGINYNNNEIEAAVEELGNIEISFTAAFAVRDNTDITDKLAVFYCSLLEDFDSIIPQVKEIRKTIAAKIGIRADYIIPVAKEDIPKTSIGKIQRSRLVKRFETGYFDGILRETDIALKNENTVPAWFFKREWSKKASLPAKRTITADNCLIIQDDRGLGEKLAHRLENHGTRCIRVKLAGQFKKKNPDYYEIDDKEPGDYNRLLQAIHKDQIEIKDVFHLAGYGNIKEEPGQVGSDWYGADGLLNFIRAVNNTIRPSLVRIFVASSHTRPAAANDEIFYEKCGMPGLLKCVSREIPWLQCCHLDLEITAPEIDNIEAILTEWQNPVSDTEVAYRNNSRLVPYLSHIDMKHEAAGDLPLKKQGLYLVTGGLGGIGTHLCKWLMEKFQAKLIIIGRTVLPDRENWKMARGEENTVISQRIRAYLEIEAGGGEFIYESGDISDELFLKQIMEKAKAKWGQSLSGIFHLAGISNPKNNGQSPEEQMVLSEGGEIFTTLERMSRAKVYGTLNLHRLIEDNPDTLFVAFSSVISLFGAVAYGAYAAVNGFLDGFCHQRRRSGYPNTYCLNWSSWQDTGMSTGNLPGQEQAMRRSGYEFINPGQGLNSLLMALQCQPDQYLIGMDSTNKNLRALQQKYPIGKQVLHIYYTGKEKSFDPKTNLPPIAANIFPGGYKGNNIIMAFHRVDSIPMKDGVIDYARLAAGDKNRPGSRLELDLPRTPREKALVKLWQEVLGNVRIGIDDHFFELGGHSLQAIMLTAKIHKEFHIKVSLKDIFQAPTIREFSQYLQGLETTAYRAVDPAEEKEYYPLSSAQQRFYVMQQIDAGSIAYNLALTVELHGHIDAGSMEKTFKRLIKRHESLRTSFEIINEEPVQRIHRYHEVNFGIETHDLQTAGASGTGPGSGSRKKKEKEQASILIGSLIRPFDLSRPPLLRVILMKVEKEKHILMIDTHHIMMDHISGSILIRDTTALYRGEQLPQLRLRYKDYCRWKEKQDGKNSRALKKQGMYWLGEFNGEIPLLKLPLDFDRPAVKTFAGAKFTFALGEKQSRGLMEISRQENATLFMVLLAVYVILLYKLSRQQEIIVGIPIAGRDHADLQEILGVFLNMLAIKTAPAPGKTFAGFLKEVKEKALNAFENQEYPFEELVDKVGVKKAANRNPLFDVGFDLKNTMGEKENPPGPGTVDANVKIKPYEHEYGSAKLDIGFFGRTAGQQIFFVLEYSTQLFKKNTMERFVNYFKEIVDMVIENQGIQLKHISISHDLTAAKLSVLEEDRGDFAF